MGHFTHIKKIAAGIGVVGALTAMSIAPAMAADTNDSSGASASVTAGDRAITLGDVAFGAFAYQYDSHTKNVLNVEVGVVDNSGSDAGYQISMTSTALASAGTAPDIAATNFSVTAVDTITTVDGTEPPIAGSGAATGNLSAGQMVLAATAGTGAGSYTAAVDFALTFPDNTLADAYSGTLSTTFAVAP